MVREEVASYPRWNVSSASTDRNAEGIVEDDRRIEILWERIGCSDTKMLEGRSVVVVAVVAVVVDMLLCGWFVILDW